jgi:predicted ester cyclase
MSTKDIEGFTRRNVEAVNKGKAAVFAFIDQHYAADIIMHGLFGGETRGLKECKQTFSELYDVFPDLHFTLDDEIVKGDKVAIRWTATGTHKGTFMGGPPTNKKITTWVLEIDRFVNGKLAEVWARFDTFGFMQQLGVIPAPKKEK